MFKKSYYDILELSPNATYEQIKEQYEKKKNKSNADVVEKAYRILSDPYKRGKYDAKYKIRMNKYNQLFRFPFSNIDGDIFKNGKSIPSSSYSYSSHYVKNNDEAHTKHYFELNNNGNKKQYGIEKKYINGKWETVDEYGDAKFSEKSKYKLVRN